MLVSSQNQNREWIYSQQTTSAEGFAGQAFNTHVHIRCARRNKDLQRLPRFRKNDNNALAGLLLQGTNFVNFMGRYVYIAADHALEVVVATERDEPQAVMAARFRRLRIRRTTGSSRGGSELKTFYEHVGNPRVLQVQLRGEYAYVAAGEGRLRV